MASISQMFGTVGGGSRGTGPSVGLKLFVYTLAAFVGLTLALGAWVASLKVDPTSGDAAAVLLVDMTAMPRPKPLISVSKAPAPPTKLTEALPKENEEGAESAASGDESDFLSIPGVSFAGSDPVVVMREGSPFETGGTPSAASAGQAADSALASHAETDALGEPLTPVPVAALVEESSYGPLPKVAEDGRRPSLVYARPVEGVKSAQNTVARVAIIIGGMGLSETFTRSAIERLPSDVSLAFAPYGSNLQGWVRQARETGHEALLEVPMEPYDYPDNDPGPQTLLTSLSAKDNLKRLKWLMARFTGYAGVTNAMGAKFVSARESFEPVLKELQTRGLVFVDNGRSQRSTAGDISRKLGMGYRIADVRIDADETKEGTIRSLVKLEEIAKERGVAVGIGRAVPATIDLIAQWAKGLEARGVVLIPVTAAIRKGQS